ncbi:MAG: zinc ribbon domain-containing protein, partial [Gammaproteobacteria bacterium]|nr:zinc ribbon domain-containing protein [Gammaproteobacteria bacterium]
MKCTACQHDNEAIAMFCEECGAKLTLTCASCGTELKATAKFCVKCGTSATASATSSPTRRVADYTPKHLAD